MIYAVLWWGKNGSGRVEQLGERKEGERWKDTTGWTRQREDDKCQVGRNLGSFSSLFQSMMMLMMIIASGYRYSCPLTQHYYIA